MIDALDGSFPLDFYTRKRSIPGRLRRVTSFHAETRCAELEDRHHFD